jgi:aspartate/methionine/tyrosine aminotransferase
MKYVRMPIEIESPEQMGYSSIECNLTESSFKDMTFGEFDLDLKDLVLCYGDHLGLSPLRKMIAEEYGLKAQDCLLSVGAASALFIISTSLLNEGDHLIVVKPNYGTNIETPKAMGIEMDFLNISFEKGFKLSIDEIRKKIKPSTKLISLTQPHNPTGVMLSESEIREVVKICEEKKIYFLLDETYREMTFKGMTPLAATLSPFCISVSSLSKTYGLPGIRLGWILTKNPKLQELFLAAKEQIFICHSLLDETVALHFYEKMRTKRLEQNLKKIKEHFLIVKNWIENEKRMEWVEPSGGVVCFPRFKIEAGIDTEKFYQILNQEYKTYVGPGHWFEMPKEFMRIGYGWPTTSELVKGLKNISLALDRSAKH